MSKELPEGAMRLPGPEFYVDLEFWSLERIADLLTGYTFETIDHKHRDAHWSSNFELAENASELKHADGKVDQAIAVQWLNKLSSTPSGYLLRVIAGVNHKYSPLDPAELQQQMADVIAKINADAKDEVGDDVAGARSQPRLPERNLGVLARHPGAGRNNEPGRGEQQADSELWDEVREKELKFKTLDDVLESPYWNIIQCVHWVFYREPFYVAEAGPSNFAPPFNQMDLVIPPHVDGASIEGRTFMGAFFKLRTLLQDGELTARAAKDGFGDVIPMPADAWISAKFELIVGTRNVVIRQPTDGATQWHDPVIDGRALVKVFAELDSTISTPATVTDCKTREDVVNLTGPFPKGQRVRKSNDWYPIITKDFKHLSEFEYNRIANFENFSSAEFRTKVIRLLASTKKYQACDITEATIKRQSTVWTPTTKPIQP